MQGSLCDIYFQGGDHEVETVHLGFLSLLSIFAFWLPSITFVLGDGLLTF